MFFDFWTFNPLPIVFWQFWGHLRSWSLEEAGGKQPGHANWWVPGSKNQCRNGDLEQLMGLKLCRLIFCRDTLTHPTICTLNFHIFFAANVLKRAGHVQGQRWSGSTAGKSAVAGRGLQLTPGVQKVGDSGGSRFTTNLWHFLYGNLSEPGTRKGTAPKQ